MNSFMSWIGGKKALRHMILPLFPREYERYIEVFGGAGWVLFGKHPGNDYEVFNDFNALLVNLYRCVRELPDQLISELTYVLNSRLDFEYAKRILKEKTEIPHVRNASYFYQLIRYSYASGLTSYGNQPHDMWSNFPVIYQAYNRLRKVVVENKDFEKLIGHYDRPSSFFYCDPPYFMTEKHYMNIGEAGFRKEDHYRLFNKLSVIKGKFLLSYNDCEFIRELYKDFYFESVTRLNNIALRFDKGSEFPELLIANYDLKTESRKTPEQMMLFDWG